MQTSKLTPETTALFVCDVQGRFSKILFGWQEMLDGIVALSRGATALGCPVVVTEQCPDKLGSTTTELSFLSSDSDGSESVNIFPKTLFSMVTPEVRSLLNTDRFASIENVILCGLETHICITQTCMDLLQLGLHPIVVVDATSSSNKGERQIALARLQRLGVVLTSVSSVLFELLGDSTHPKFRSISGLVIELGKRPETLLDV